MGWGDYFTGGSNGYDPGKTYGGDRFSGNPETAWGGWFGGGGSKDPYKGIEDAYGRANNRISPYADQGAQQWGNYNNWLNSQGQLFNGKYGNPADWAWKNANMSPTDWSKNIMSSYEESPEAKNTMAAMQNAMNNQGSASGMVGSGAFDKELQQNANNISQGDQQRYFNNAMTAYQNQMAAAQNYQQQQANWAQGMQWASGMGYNAANKMGDNDVNAAGAKVKGQQEDEKKQQEEMAMLAKVAMMFFM